jgi:hypothetical protein
MLAFCSRMQYFVFSVELYCLKCAVRISKCFCLNGLCGFFATGCKCAPSLAYIFFGQS